MMFKQLGISLIFCSSVLLGQDLHFSQFNEHHALVNPALTGTDGDYRALMAYKNQWRKASGKEPYKTFGTSFESKVLGGSWKKAGLLPKKYREQNIGRLGAGLSIYRDKAGDADMSQTQINLSVAGFVPTSRWSYLSLGIQAGAAFRRADATNLIFPNQYGLGGYDASINSGEEVPLERYRYFDFATGLLWSYGYEDKGFATKKTTRAKFGVSAYHITQPNLRVIGRAEEKLFMKLVVHGDMFFSIEGTKIAIAPSFLFQKQGPSMEIILGSTVKYFEVSSNTKYTNRVKTTAVSAGLYYRTADAIIMQFLYEKEERWAYGLSYDLNVSSLRKANKLRGGPELLVRFTPQKVSLTQKNNSSSFQ